MPVGPLPAPANSPTPRGVNAMNQWVRSLIRDVPNQLERSKRARLALRKAKR